MTVGQAVLCFILQKECFKIGYKIVNKVCMISEGKHWNINVIMKTLSLPHLLFSPSVIEI